MLVAVFSDVHANEAALRAVLAEIDLAQPDYVLALGDFVGKGPRPDRCLKLLRSRSLSRTRGRWDTWVAGAEDSPAAWKQARTDGDGRPRAWIEAARRLLDARDLEELASPPESRTLAVGAHRLAFAHGALPEMTALVAADTPEPELPAILAGIGAEVVAFGHARAPFVRASAGHLVVNAGSVGCPVIGDPRASFALIHLEEGAGPRAEIVRVPYPLEEQLHAARAARRKGKLPARLEERYLRLLLGQDHEAEPGPLAPADFGSPLLVKLLARRTHAVYARAADPWPEDVGEQVHDLRVAIRRLREALALARPILDPVRWNRVERRAQRLGRRLGARRILDVSLGHAHQLFGREHPFSRDLDDTRTLVLDRFHARYSSRRLLRHGLEALALAVSPPLFATEVETLGSEHLLARVRDARALLPAMQAPELTAEQHRFRVRMKRVRYACEVLRDIFPGLGELNGELKRVQDALGEHNDAQELLLTARRFARRRRKKDAPLDVLSERARTGYLLAEQLVGALVPRLLERVEAAVRAG